MPDLLRMHLVAIFAPIAGAMLVIGWRLRETRRPVSLPKIVMPPLGMATGFGMFALPAFRVQWTWALGAFLIGAVIFGHPLSRSSSLERLGDEIMLRRSKGFLTSIVGVVTGRLALRGVVGGFFSHSQTAALFFVLAFGMILRWRTGMLLQYRRMLAEGPHPRLALVRSEAA